MNGYQTITYDVADGIATITLSRPEQRNTVTYAMLDELIDAFDRIDANRAVRAVIVTGDGEFFSAGTTGQSPQGLSAPTRHCVQGWCESYSQRATC